MIINSSGTVEDEGKRGFFPLSVATVLLGLYYCSILQRPDSNPNEALDVVPCGRS